MSTQRTITIQFDDREYERLLAAARRKGTSPEALLRFLVHDVLHESEENDPERRKREALAALDRLAELTRDLPEIDAVQIVRDGRDELEQRSIF